MSEQQSLPEGWTDKKVWDTVIAAVNERSPCARRVSYGITDRLWDCCGSASSCSTAPHSHQIPYYVFSTLRSDAPNPDVQRGAEADSIRIKDKDGTDMFISWRNA